MFDLSAFRTAVSMINGPQNKLYIDVISEAADEIEQLRKLLRDQFERNTQTPVGAAMKIIVDAMKADDDMANGWHANIAVLMTDEGVPYDRAQKRASSFMKLAFDCDTLNLERQGGRVDG